MKRNGDEVNARPDASGFQLLDELCAVDRQHFQVQAQHVEMPGMSRIRAVRQLQLCQISERVAVTSRKGLSGGGVPVELSELMDADRGLDVRQVVFEARFHYLVEPLSAFRVTVPRILGNAVEGQHSHALGE